MAKLWHPDSCVDPPCIIDVVIVDTHYELGKEGFIRVCKHHSSNFSHLDEAALLRLINDTSKVKNYAQHAVAVDLGISPNLIEHSIDKNNRVVLKIPNSNQSTRALQAANLRVGPGKVIIE